MGTILFFCDIRGTITGTDDFKMLIDKLDKLKKNYGSKRLIFSLISTENFATVNQYAKKINQDNNKTIILGKQFCEDGYIDYQSGIISDEIKDKSKLGQMINYSKEISEKYDLDLICYADDCAYGAYSEVLNKINPKAEIKIIIPAQKIVGCDIISTLTPEINGLYECLDKIIYEKKSELDSLDTKHKRA